MDSVSGSIDSLTDKTQTIYQENTGQKDPNIEEAFTKNPNLAFKGLLETDNGRRVDAAISHLTGQLDEKTQELNLLEGSGSVVEVVNGVQNEILDPEKVEEEIRNETNNSQNKTDELDKDKDSSKEASTSILENAHNTINMLNEK